MKRQGSSVAFVMPTRRLTTTAGSSEPGARARITIGPSARLVPFSCSFIPRACVSLPGPGAEVRRARQAPARPHAVDPGERRQRADQHPRADPGRLADGVQHRVDAVGAIDVGAAGLTAEDPRPGGQPDEGMGGRLFLVVGLRLDDHAGGLAVPDGAPQQLQGHLEHGAIVEGGRQRRGPGERGLHRHASAAAACSSCSLTRARAVPPRETFDSSQESWPSTRR